MTTINKINLNGTEYTIGGQDLPIEVKTAIDNLFANALYNDYDSSGDYAVYHAWASAITLVSITATFVQGETVIYPCQYDKIKEHLTVTAHYSNGTSTTVSNYALVGADEAGTATVTAIYQGKTTTFTVTISDGILYQLPEATTFTGDSSERISAGLDIEPLATDDDFTITFEITRDGTYTNDSYVFQCLGEVTSSTYWGAKFQISKDKYYLVSFQESSYVSEYTPTSTGVLKCVARHAKGENTITWALTKSGTAFEEHTLGTTLRTGSAHLFIGGNGYKGTIDSFAWYKYRFTDEQTSQFLGLQEGV